MQGLLTRLHGRDVTGHVEDAGLFVYEVVNRSGGVVVSGVHLIDETDLHLESIGPRSEIFELCALRLVDRLLLGFEDGELVGELLLILEPAVDKARVGVGAGLNGRFRACLLCLGQGFILGNEFVERGTAELVCGHNFFERNFESFGHIPKVFEGDFRAVGLFCHRPDVVSQVRESPLPTVAGFEELAREFGHPILEYLRLLGAFLNRTVEQADAERTSGTNG